MLTDDLYILFSYIYITKSIAGLGKEVLIYIGFFALVAKMLPKAVITRENLHS